MATLTPNFTRLHNPYCNCFDCMPDHADALLSINNFLGFGVKIGDLIETSKVVILYDGKGGAKAIAPPMHFTVRSVDPKFLTFSNRVIANTNGDYVTDPAYDMSFINNDPTTYIVIPPLLKGTVQAGQKVTQAVKDVANAGLNIFGDLWGTLKWVFLGIAALLVILIILRFTGK